MERISEADRSIQTDTVKSSPQYKSQMIKARDFVRDTRESEELKLKVDLRSLLESKESGSDRK